MTPRGVELLVRTRKGKPFNVPAGLTLLRNRAYLGEISFRGNYHPAPHEPLIEKELFERAQEILQGRSENVSLRRSNQSEYLLTGLVKCAHCGNRYLGASANGSAAATATTSASPTSATARAPAKGTAASR